jgi:hypothetical protein
LAQPSQFLLVLVVLAVAPAIHVTRLAIQVKTLESAPARCVPNSTRRVLTVG